jgi:hypothetical protein
MFAAYPGVYVVAPHTHLGRNGAGKPERVLLGPHPENTMPVDIAAEDLDAEFDRVCDHDHELLASSGSGKR